MGMALLDPLNRCFGFVLDQLAPRRCPGCDREHLGTQAFCPSCCQSLEGPVTAHCLLDTASTGQALDVRALGMYRPPLSTAIRRVKYARRADLVAALAKAWLRAHPGVDASLADCLVPVPLHPRRLVERGFNQSALLAGQLARRLGMRQAPTLLRKVANTPSQASLDFDQRRTNLAHAFSADRGRLPSGWRVILIDDVVTTGETVRACTRALAEARVSVVEIWALARTPRESRP